MCSKRYPEEFKIEAVRQVTERRHSVAEVDICTGGFSLMELEDN